MYRKVYKYGSVELSEEPFAVRAEPPKPATPVKSEQDSEVEDGMIADDSPAILDPQAIEAIFRDAEEQAAGITAAARQKAAEQSNAVLLQAQQEAEGIRQNAYAEGKARGYAEGTAAKVSAIEQLIARLESAVSELEGGFSGFISEYESNLKWAVLEVSSKVLGRIIERDELELVELVKTAVEQVKNSEWINLHLCNESVELIERMRRELAPIRQLEVVPDDLPQGSCLLDMPSGKLDASIDTQLRNLQEYFRAHTEL